VVSLIAGGLLLFDRSVPGAQVSPGVIAPVAIGTALFFYFVVKAALKTRHLPQSVKSQAALGATGYATTDLAPGGIVHVAAETWTAEATGPVAKGQKVRVIGVEGLRLKVEAIEDGPQQLKLEE
jgi:membrane-bound serine protease (ClpP class)